MRARSSRRPSYRTLCLLFLFQGLTIKLGANFYLAHYGLGPWEIARLGEDLGVVLVWSAFVVACLAWLRFITTLTRYGRKDFALAIRVASFILWVLLCYELVDLSLPYLHPWTP